MSFRDDLSTWIDWDCAGAALARHIGLIDNDTAFGGNKAMFWTDNPVGNALMEALDRLAGADVLEKREEPDIQFRWNCAHPAARAQDGDLKPGDAVRHYYTGEVGRIVATWNDGGDLDCYVAFFGTKLPEQAAADPPYILRYYSSSLEPIAPKKG